MKFIKYKSLALYFALTSYSINDCDFKSIIPVDHGTTKFKAINTLLETNKYKKYQESNFLLSSDYLVKENKKVIKTTVYFEITSSDCFNGDNKSLELVFANDTLYSINITEKFSLESFNKMKSEYERLKMIFQNKFKYAATYIQTSEGKQIGEGWRYTKKLEQGTQPEELDIGFSMYNEWRPGGFQDIYTIKINYLNLQGMPIDSRGF